MDILRQLCEAIISANHHEASFATRVMTNVQNTFAGDANIQVLAKTSKGKISPEAASAEPRCVSNASQAAEEGKNVSLTSARHLSEKRISLRRTKTRWVGLLSVTLAQKRDTHPRIRKRTPAVPARRSLAAMACFKAKTSPEQRRKERRSVRVAFSDELDEVR